VQTESFRRTGNRLWLAACGMLFFLIALTGVFTSWDKSADAPASIEQQLVLAPAAIACLWITVRILRQGIFAKPSALTVRNVLRTSELAWDEITSIDPPLPYPAWRKAGIRVELTDGRTVSAGLYAAGPFNSTGFADEVVARLRQLWRLYQSPPHNGS
jgi:hypothetical protein